VGQATDLSEELLETLLQQAFGQGEAGVRTLHAYASPKLRSKLGDLSVFQRAFGNELYAPLLSSAGVRAARPQVIGDSARSELTLEQDGETVTYLLGMVRAKGGPQDGRWCVSGVVREGVDL